MFQVHFIFILEPAWHLILGGNGPPFFYLSTVELYNWQTGEQCQLKDLPYGVAAQAATVMDDVPVFCGGDSGRYENRCFKLNKADQSWIQVGYLIYSNILTFLKHKHILTTQAGSTRLNKAPKNIN